MKQVRVYPGVPPKQLESLYADPYIARVGHDHRPAAPIFHPLATYLSATVDGAFAGAFLAIRQTALELELHALLKKTFLPHSRQLGHAFLAWCFNCNPVLRVTAYIIEGLERARNYCLKLGMQLEGFRRHACLQNGKAKGLYILGMTRQDWSTQS